MIKKIKNFTTRLIAGANVATVIVMLLAGFSDRLNPADHPLLSTAGMTFPIFLLVNMAFVLFWVIFKWRMLWIPIAGYLLAYAPISIYFPVNRSLSVPDDALKIISYNVCAYGGNYKYDDGFGTVINYLAEESPDIICLQEDVDIRHKTIFESFKKNGYNYNDTVVLANKTNSYNALGIHSRHPIIKRERIDYPSHANGSAAWWLKIGADTVIVINNHFESCHLTKNDRQQYRQIIRGEMDRDSVRAESKLLLVKLAEANAKRSGQIRAVRDYVVDHQQYPVIVCGDFNDNPISYSHHTMRQVLTDCFAETGHGIGLSYNQKAFSFRIDHLFCSNRLEPYNCKIDGQMDASDHYPLICWLKIRQKQ